MASTTPAPARPTGAPPGGRGGGGGGGGPTGGASSSDASAALRAAAADRSLLRRVVALFTPYRGPVAGVGVLVLASSGLGVVSPLLVEVVFDRGLFRRGGPDVALVLELSAVMVAITVFVAALGVWQDHLTARTGQQVMRDLRGELFAHLQQLSLRFFTGVRTGDVQSRLENDVGGPQTVITDTASSILGNAVTLVSTLVAMLVLSRQLTLLSLALLPLFVWLTGRVGQLRRELTGQTQVALSEVSAVTQESLSVSGVLLAKLFGRHDIVEADDALVLPREVVRGEVALQDVWFSYEGEPGAGTDRPRCWALQGLDLTAGPGAARRRRGGERRGQDDDQPPHPAAVRRRPRHRLPRRPRRPQADAGLAGRSDRDWSPRRPTCSTPRCARSWPAPGRTPTWRRSSSPRGPRTSTSASWSWRTATTPPWGSAGTGSRVGRSSASPSPGCS